MSEYLSEAFLLKFLKFGIVGFSGLFVDFGITYITKEWLKVPKYLANAIGFSVAASTNYILNRIWTFQSHDPEIALEFSLFFGISLIGLAINTLILWTLVSKFKFNFYLSKLFAIGVVTIWNFLANYFITFQ
ncbi:MAG: GtrA family protein [Bacteroidetes bacterium]|nr:MAG: GtrA family protein [Bacteroidota bacterium]